GEVDARREPPQQARREDRQEYVRRLPAVARPRHRARLDRPEAVATLTIGVHSAETPEIRVERQTAGVGGMRVTTGCVRLPDLEERPRDRHSILLPDRTHDLDRPTLGRCRARPDSRQVVLARLQKKRTEEGA